MLQLRSAELLVSGEASDHPAFAASDTRFSLVVNVECRSGPMRIIDTKYIVELE